MPKDKKQEPAAVLRLNILNLDKVVFEGHVRAISTFNEKGPLDILYMHENFISIIKKSVKVYKLDGTEQIFEIDEGIMKVMGNRVDVYLGLKK